MDEEGERGNKLFIIPTKGKSLFTFVISIEIIRGWLARGRDESKFGVSTISRRREAGDLRLGKGRKGRGGVIHSSLRLAYEIYTNVKHGVFGRGGLFPVLLSFSSKRSKRPSSSFYRRGTDTRREREREREPSLHFSSDASERLEIDKRPFHPAR